MRYGEFDQANREYVVQRPDTPAPWRNYLGNGSYRAIVSHLGGGYSYHRDPNLLRVLRDRPRALPDDRPGRYLYVRDRETGDYWSPTWQPVMADLDQYECRHGMGYTHIRGQRGEISAHVTYLVPIDEHLELWICTVRNLSDRPRTLDLFTYAEFSLWGVLKDLLNQQASKYVGMVRYQEGVIFHETRSDSAGPKGDEAFVLHRAYFGCGRTPTGFDVQRAEFVGPWRDEGRPLAVERGACSGTEYLGFDPIAALQLPLDLAPGQEETLVFVLGVDDEGTEWRERLSHFTQPDHARRALAEVKSYWAERLDCFQIETPDSGMNAVFNAWNPYQTVNTFLTPRGYRDTSQDVLGIAHLLPGEVRKRLLVLLSHEFRSGWVTHDYSAEEGFSVITKGVMRDGDIRPTGVGGETLEAQYGSPASDPSLWALPAVCNYVKETGDFSLLHETLPFLDGGESNALDHLQRILRCVWQRRGLHGLPLIREMDWNDSLNLPAGSVSVWLGMLFVWAARELAQLLARPEVTGDPAPVLAMAEEMAETINQEAWDGRWYARAFLGDGEPVGAASCESYQIDYMPQAWAVMTGIANQERALSAMDAVRERCFTPYGLALMDPPYTRYQPRYGAISVIPASMKENGGIFNHPINWAILAECLLGRGDRAWEYYHSFLPSTKNEFAEIHQMEPYIFSQFVCGPYHPRHGLAGRAWMTGTAAWAMVVASQYLLGIRPDYDGLRLRPCLPSGWTGYRARRKFRGATYEIEVMKPAGLCTGPLEIALDGRPVAGDLLPLAAEGEVVRVHARMQQTP